MITLDILTTIEQHACKIGCHPKIMYVFKAHKVRELVVYNFTFIAERYMDC